MTAMTEKLKMMNSMAMKKMKTAKEVVMKKVTPFTVFPVISKSSNVPLLDEGVEDEGSGEEGEEEEGEDEEEDVGLDAIYKDNLEVNLEERFLV